MARTISILALVFAILMPVVGLILAIVALATKPKGEPDGLAIAALIVNVFTFVFFIVFVAAIASFGVFNPQRFAQERCVGDSTKFACTSNAVSVNDGTVSFQVINGAGYPVTVTGLTVSGSGSCDLVSWDVADMAGSSVKGSEIQPNEKIVLEADCGSQRSGRTFQDTFTVDYDMVGGVKGLQGDIDVVVNT